MAEVIGFVSGKGGMGKTALCAAIAVSLADAGRKVLCIDCHDVWGDLDAYLGLEGLPHLTYGEVCRGQYPLEKATAHPAFSRLRFLAAPASDEALESEAFAALLRQARQQFDYILLDDPKEEMSADRYILVTKPNPAAIRGARRRADVLEVQGKRNTRLIVNMVDIKQMAALELNVDDVMDGAGLGLLGIVPYDWNITAACAAGKNLHTITKKGAAAALQRIVARIQGIHTAIPSRL